MKAPSDFGLHIAHIWCMLARNLWALFLLSFVFSAQAHAGRRPRNARSVKAALLAHQKAQKDRGTQSTVTVRKVPSQILRNARVLILGRKKGDVLNHPKLGRVTVTHAQPKNEKGGEVTHAQVIVTQSKLDASGKSWRIITADKIPYEPTKRTLAPKSTRSFKQKRTSALAPK